MASGKFALKSGVDYLPHYNWEPGMNDDLAQSDRAGWTTSEAMLTGGQTMDWGALGSLEVGNCYDLDPMGEERKDTTFSHDDPSASGHIGIMGAEGAPGMQPTQTTSGGKSVDISSPQTYNKIDAYPKR